MLLALNQIQIRAEESPIPTEKKEAILKSVEAMRQSAGTASFTEKYKDFMSVAADHLTLFQAFIPPLLALL
ncbi:hypothetical protein PAEH1_01565 [Paenalcaligenes hominis]|uniref:Uncharacterized protein n=1 Tax=Paenalcaligenes hominis TaxID=643674 RepID=A0A1U9JXQ6_9BURK|nr:hypothetical protein [Paenalcaligenes hominis]AQS50567.1 hypothetical protein PAEH1_01565 [Paenalcaligenes hominis]